MTSKWITSAPASSTERTSAPRFAKSAERIEGASQGVCLDEVAMAMSLRAPRALDELVRLDDLLRTLFGVFEHRFGEAIGLELVRMMFGELPAVSLGHLVVRGLGID